MSRAAHIRVDRDDPDGLAPLAGKEFDAVVDVSRHPRVDGLVSASGIEALDTGSVSNAQAVSRKPTTAKFSGTLGPRPRSLHKFRMIAHIMSATARSSFVRENMF